MVIVRFLEHPDAADAKKTDPLVLEALEALEALECVMSEGRRPDFRVALGLSKARMSHISYRLL